MPSAGWCSHWSVTRWKSGRPGAALELLDGLWSADLALEDCWHLRGQSLYDLGRIGEAAQVTGQGLARAPRSVALLFLLSNCESALGNPSGAERALLGALALESEQPVLLSRYAELLVHAGRTDEAAGLLARAELAAPGHPLVEHARLALSDAEARAGDGVTRSEGPDPYARAGIGLSLLMPVFGRPAAGSDGGSGRWIGMVVRLALVGGAIVLVALGFRLAAALLLVTALAGPRLWRARG